MEDQPALAIIKARGLKIVDVAREIDVGYFHLYNTLHGRTHPNPDLREKLPAYLGVPLNELYTADLLSIAYNPAPRRAWRP